MRNVLSNTDEVMHVWAHQGQSSGRCGNVSFNGTRLFSYAATIARITSNDAGETAVLVTSRRYSITTSGHTSGAHSAARHMTRFSVGNPDASPDAIRLEFASGIERLTLEIPEGRTAVNKAKRYRELQRHVASCNAFCRFFGLAEFPAPADADMDRIVAETTAKREEQEKDRRDRAAKEASLRLKRVKADLKRWLKGEAVGSLYGLPVAYMRLDREGNTIETTLGATVPVDHVRRLAPRILELVKAKQAYVPERDIRFGHYRLDRIEANGTVVVGCHRFEAAEIARVAALLTIEPALA